MTTLTCKDVLQILASHKEELARGYGLLKLGVFGSIARNEATEGSDIDIVVETRTPDLLRMVNLKEDLEKILHERVDVVRYRQRMNALLKKRIDKDAHYV
ncbi:MAG: nucleotidyltransferase domain-containing protein [Proteobacteria bacterium]|nr:nucleotidyltransferase domain-containing protein [Pseudomonadota bacterium]